MAALTFTDLQSEVYGHCGLDSSDTTTIANVKRWINYVQQDLIARYPWPFMEGRESIVTIPDYTTGTISISAASTTVTGSGTTFPTAAGDGTYFIQIYGANDWYAITTRGSATSLTLATAYQATSSASAVTYTIRKFYYSLSSACDRIVDIRNWGSPMKLVQVDVRTVDELRPNPQSTNSPYGYMTWLIDSSGNLQISPYPFPSDARVFEVRTFKRPTDMSASGDSPSVPNKYAHVLAWGAIAVGFAFKGKLQMADAWSNKFEQRIKEMRMEYRVSEDKQSVLRSIDSAQRTMFLDMGDQYPIVTGGIP